MGAAAGLVVIYLGLLLFTLLGPLLFGFDARVRFNQRWREWAPALVTTAIGFTLWDAWFTRIGVWGFNADYVARFRLLDLPLEEIAFFFVVPYACLFILNVTKYYDSRRMFRDWQSTITVTLIVGLIVGAVLWRGRTYPVTAALVAAAVLSSNLSLRRDLSSFYLAFLISLIPFTLVNGVLTGTGLPAPVVWYDDARTLGIRFGTIPIDDVIYNLAMLGAAEGGPLRLARVVFDWTRSRVRDLSAV